MLTLKIQKLFISSDIIGELLRKVLKIEFLNAMDIGGEINRKIKEFLLELESHSQGNIEKHIDMDAINKNLIYSRSDLKNILEYLEQSGYINPRTIGGKWLYGHISITDKGLQKVKKWK